MRVEHNVTYNDKSVRTDIDGRIDDVAKVLTILGLAKVEEPQVTPTQVPNGIMVGGQFKIIGKDNLARENVSDFVLLENVISKDDGTKFCEHLNRGLSENDGGTLYTVVPMDYKPYVWEI